MTGYGVTTHWTSTHTGDCQYGPPRVELQSETTWVETKEALIWKVKEFFDLPSERVLAMTYEEYLEAIEYDVYMSKEFYEKNRRVERERNKVQKRVIKKIMSEEFDRGAVIEEDLTGMFEQGDETKYSILIFSEQIKSEGGSYLECVKKRHSSDLKDEKVSH